MKDVTSVLEETRMGQLGVEMCGDVLMWSGRCGMQQLQAEALAMAERDSRSLRRLRGLLGWGRRHLRLL